MSELETFKKQPLGGVDIRALVKLLAERGAPTAKDLLTRQIDRVRPAGTAIAEDAAVLVLGGSNGITRAVAMQLVFGEGAAVFGVHLDSAKMQIGPHHTAAMTEAAAAAGKSVRFFNSDATKESTITEVVETLKGSYRCVHLVNGIAAGATKRYAEHGPTLVRDLDVAFDPILQTPDFSRPESIRKLGMVEVEVATDADIERTNKFMGTSSLDWAEKLPSTPYGSTEVRPVMDLPMPS